MCVCLINVPVPFCIIFVNLSCSLSVCVCVCVIQLEYSFYVFNQLEKMFSILHSRPNIRHMETISESKIRTTNDCQLVMPIQNIWMTENVSCRNWNQRRKKRIKWTAFYWQFQIVSIDVCFFYWSTRFFLSWTKNGKKKENKKGEKLFSIEINWNRFDNVLALSILEFRKPKLFSYQLLFSISFIFPSNGFWFRLFYLDPVTRLYDIPNVEQFKFICAWESFSSGFHCFMVCLPFIFASIVLFRSSFFYCLWFSFSSEMGIMLSVECGWLWVLQGEKKRRIMHLNVGGEWRASSCKV